MYDYDVLIIGSGPAGEKAAIQAAKLGKKTGLIEKNARLGGVCIHTGTLPSKTLRETVINLSMLKSRAMHSFNFDIDEYLNIDELMYRKNIVIQKDEEVVRDQLYRNNIDVFNGAGTFIDEHTLIIEGGENKSSKISAEFIVIATGSKPYHPPDIPFDSDNVFDSTTILNIKKIPKSIAVIGGGVIGSEYACIFANLDVKVILIDSRNRLLRFLDSEFSDSLAVHMMKSNIDLHLGAQVEKWEFKEKNNIQITLDNGNRLTADIMLYAAKRTGDIEDLNLAAVNIKPDERGLLKVNKNYQTEIPNIYAVGDVIGFPSLASTSMDQGRLAMKHAFENVTTCELNPLLPFGIYTIPEISYVGETEQSLKEKNIPYGIGLAFYNEIARGLIIGDYEGMLKILFHLESREVLGVHIIGYQASELIHLGQTVMSLHGKLDYFIDTVFNFPTLTEAYKIAALYGYNRYLNK